MRTSPRFRRLVFNVHLWVGLSIGLLLVVAGVTGSILVFDHEIDTVLNPELLRVAPGPERVPLQRVANVVRKAYPERPLSYIRMPRVPGETYEITTGGADPLQVFVDPYRGTILGERGTTEGFTNALFDLHVHLLAGEAGERVMGVVGLLTLLLVVTGAVVWWQRVRRWLRGVTVRWRAGWKRVNFDLHRAAGIWSAVFLLIVAFTGSSLVFYEPFLAAANWITGSSPVAAPAAAMPRAGAPQLSLDSLLSRADQALPGGTVTYVSFPAAANAPLSVRKWFDAELHPNGRNFVYLDPWTGEVLGVENAFRVPAGTKIDNLLYPLHIGSFGGLGVRILYAVLGLAPLILFVSGCIMWWNRQAAKRRRPARSGRPSEKGIAVHS